MATSTVFTLCCLVLAMISSVTPQDSKPLTPADGVKYFRQALQVYKFTGQDYSAMFVLTVGIVLILTFAIIFIVVGLLTMDPGKDSIIYRMTTTRAKKD